MQVLLLLILTKIVSMSIIFTDKQNLLAHRMSFDGVASLIFPISVQNLCAISEISNIKHSTKEHQTSQERRHELVMMSLDVSKSLMPICLFSTYQTERSGYYLFHFFPKCSVVRYLRCYSDCRDDVIV